MLQAGYGFRGKLAVHELMDPRALQGYAQNRQGVEYPVLGARLLPGDLPDEILPARAQIPGQLPGNPGARIEFRLFFLKEPERLLSLLIESGLQDIHFFRIEPVVRPLSRKQIFIPGKLTSEISLFIRFRPSQDGSRLSSIGAEQGDLRMGEGIPRNAFRAGDMDGNMYFCGRRSAADAENVGESGASRPFMIIFNPEKDIDQ